MPTITLLKQLIACPSVTPNEAGAFAIVQRALGNFHAERFDTNGVSNLLLTRKNGEGKHLCFAGHIDVVPAGDGWAGDPFAAREQDGRIYGRGAQDMKAGVAAFASAVAAASTGAAADFRGTLSVLLTSDEEGDAIFGTKAVLEALKARGALPDMTIVAEPTCETTLGDTLKIGRRGSISGVLTLFGKSGHIAYPEKFVNPFDALARVLPKLSGKKLDPGDDDFAPSLLVISDIRGDSEAVNITPETVKVSFNVRNSSLTNAETLRWYIENVLQDAQIEQYDLAIKINAAPFTATSPKLINTLSQAIKSQCGIAPELSTGGGTSDARFFAEYGVAVAEFGVPNDLIHAANESVLISDVKTLEKVFSELIRLLND